MENSELRFEASLIFTLALSTIILTEYLLPDKASSQLSPISSISSIANGNEENDSE